jgi:transcriptional regulator with XRE-family HTH domain
MNFSSLSSSFILEERKRLGFSQAEAGGICGVSREMWGKYERGKAVMGTEVLSKFVLSGADAVYVLTGIRSMPVTEQQSTPLNREEEVLLDNFRNSSPEAKAALKATSNALAQREVNKKIS